MSDDNAPQGQAPDSAQSAASQAPAAQPVAVETPKTFDEKYVTELREEAAGYRKQLRDAQAAIKELQATAGESKTLTDKLAALEAALTEAESKADAARKQSELLRLAAKAGVDPDVASLLDLSKIDLTNEAKALETLAKLGRSAGSQARPGNGQPASDAEMRASIFGPRKSSIFGG